MISERNTGQRRDRTDNEVGIISQNKVPLSIHGVIIVWIYLETIDS